MQQQAEIGVDVAKAAQYLLQGQCIGIPTETVYGLAANAFDADAVTSIFKIKERPSFDPLIVHIGAKEQLFRLVQEPIPLSAAVLAEAFWPGPLTLVLPKSDLIPYQVTSGLDSVGVRMPNHTLTLELLQLLDFPLAAPSANPFGYISPTTAAHVAAQLGAKIPYILDGGACEIGVESTIVGFEDEEPVVYRLGAVTLDMLERKIGKVRVHLHQNSNPKAPGMIDSHYAPRKKLHIWDQESIPDLLTGFIRLQTFHAAIPEQQQYILSASGDVFEMARNLYAALRWMDNQPIREIWIELPPAAGIGAAIHDRIKRAATPLHT